MLVTGSYLPFLWGWAPSLTTLAGVGAGLPLSQPRSGQARPPHTCPAGLSCLVPGSPPPRGPPGYF